jgi:hypothetical protein
LASSPFYQNGIEYEATKTVKRFLVDSETGELFHSSNNSTQRKEQEKDDDKNDENNEDNEEERGENDGDENDLTNRLLYVEKQRQKKENEMKKKYEEFSPKKNKKKEVKIDKKRDKDSPPISIERVIYTVSAIDSFKNSLLWEVSVSEYVGPFKFVDVFSKIFFF